MKGRKKKPRAIVELEGNPGKRNLKKSSQNLKAEDIKKAYLEIQNEKKKKESERKKIKEERGDTEEKLRGKKKLEQKQRTRDEEQGKTEKNGKEERNRKGKKKYGKGEWKGGMEKQKVGGKGKRTGGVEKGTPLCPAWLDVVAKREWRRIAPILKRLGLLTVIDRTALAGYCQAYARWRQAELLITKIDELYSKQDKIIKKSHFVREAQKYLEICKSMCVEFGMTPSSRGRMVLPSGGDKKDEFEELLDG